LWLLLPIPGRADLIVVDGIAAFSSLIWLLGVFVMTTAALNVYGPAMRLARWSVRVTQLLWPLVFAAILVHDMSARAGAPSPQWQACWFIGRIIAGAGVLVFLYMIAIPAFDAGCDDESKRLIAVFWGLLIVSPLAGLIPRGIAPGGAGWVFYGFLSIFILLWAILVGVAVHALLALAGAAASVSRDLSRRGGRDERIRSARAALTREAQRQIRRYPDEAPQPTGKIGGTGSQP